MADPVDVVGISGHQQVAVGGLQRHGVDAAVTAVVDGQLAVRVETAVQAAVGVVARQRPARVCRRRVGVVDRRAKEQRLAAGQDGRAPGIATLCAVDEIAAAHAGRAKAGVRVAVGVVAHLGEGGAGVRSRLDPAVAGHDDLAVALNRQRECAVVVAEVGYDAPHAQAGGVVHRRHADGLGHRRAVVGAIVDDEGDCTAGAGGSLRAVEEAELAQRTLPLGHRSGAGCAEDQHTRVAVVVLADESAGNGGEHRIDP